MATILNFPQDRSSKLTFLTKIVSGVIILVFLYWMILPLLFMMIGQGEEKENRHRVIYLKRSFTPK